jgi:hypothetical protein
MTWEQRAKRTNALIVVQAFSVSIDVFLFFIMIASMLLTACDVECLGFCLMGSPLLFSMTYTHVRNPCQLFGTGKWRERKK